MYIAYLLLFCSVAVYCKDVGFVKKYEFPQLFRDHVYHDLSKNGKEMFFAVNIHPSCFQKKGECIPRARCVDKKMLYISRSCYRRDLVCCYDNSIQNPDVWPDSHLTVSTARTKIGH